MRFRTSGVVTTAPLATPTARGSAPNQAPGAAAKPAGAEIAGRIDQTSVVDAGPGGQNLPSTPMLDKIRQKGELSFAGSRNIIGFSQLDPASGLLSGFVVGFALL